MGVEGRGFQPKRGAGISHRPYQLHKVEIEGSKELPAAGRPGDQDTIS